ncbi:hypothetical protein [Actinoplanes solisilvae]|uniref:hypothetical protein n=1 Tax=Actinoplanes solisilvae TaxID=2486853 RepID=UPI000FD6CF3D|nr:hypothetical protein [Actinoplanes solisilvae]
MDEMPRYAIRRGAVRLTRGQWVVLGGLLAVGAVAGIVLVVAVSVAAAGIAWGLTAVVVALVAAVNGRWPSSSG